MPMRHNVTPSCHIKSRFQPRFALVTTVQCRESKRFITDFISFVVSRLLLALPVQRQYLAGGAVGYSTEFKHTSKHSGLNSCI